MAGNVLYFRVDQRAIIRKLDDELASRSDVQTKANAIVANIFNRGHRMLMRDFSEHKITQEIRGGPHGTANISETLNGEGNLFAFLGFFDGQDPTKELEDMLRNISFRRTSHQRGVIYFQIINIPTKQNIHDATKMNWGNASWALAVETGDFQGGADLSHFIFKSWEGSRSKEGFQVKGYEYSEEKFNPKPYMTEILNKFTERVNNSRSKFLV